MIIKELVNRFGKKCFKNLMFMIYMLLIKIDVSCLIIILKSMYKI